MNFTEISNNITLMYGLTLLIGILLFIAYKVSTNKRPRKR